MDKNLQDFCIKNNIPFTVEFKEPWYPKPIEIPQSVINDTKKLIEIFNKAIFDSIVYGNVTFHIIDD
jgi:hypothetical protein